MPDAFDLPSAGSLRVGARIANARGVPGTLGCFALSLDDRRPLLLTSQHVLFGAGAREQEPVWALPDPGGATPDRPIGRTRHGRRALLRHADCDVHVDCATADLDARQAVACRLTPVRAGDLPEPGDAVHKLNGVNDATHGTVLATNHSEQVVIEGRSFEVRGQILVRARETAQPFSKPGDSGAALCDEDGAVVGLLWGTSARGDALACPIEPVLWVLHVELARVTENA